MNPNRRELITAICTGVGVLFAGCLGDSEDDDATGNAADPENEDNENAGNEQNAVECSFRVVLADDPPSDVLITDAEDESIDDVTAIQEILQEATDPESTFRTEEFESGEYRVFHYNSFTQAEYKEASAALEGMSTYDGDDGPAGNYIEHPDQTVAITEDCLT